MSTTMYPRRAMTWGEFLNELPNIMWMLHNKDEVLKAMEQHRIQQTYADRIDRLAKERK